MCGRFCRNDVALRRTGYYVPYLYLHRWIGRHGFFMERIGRGSVVRGTGDGLDAAGWLVQDADLSDA